MKMSKKICKNNTDNELYFMLKHMGKRYTFILMQLFTFLFYFNWVILFFSRNENVFIGTTKDNFK